ncbi:xanthine dehydrogenase accessory protein XdhC [Gluconacetobacter diazotrophicus PA1 5]|uniref:xanthine dehydrogenase accessory protein XdhC n=1 Tax=Gluconacetobacter diazotrophicus TaxID=33996 RepID=UPI000173CAD4|nr:xanthine dehydrogenase accessory protein XdhC [Gluconacetobacter diazotrophicus]ACI50021.1 xanthine dehydrogenase accessory protein XdhC [Gluconacetobacter diazotrophicus PA1 5]TWB07899.1 xanthine dehydrogenase accessory factor [Gluconacetobacter diazotrophicus]
MDEILAALDLWRPAGQPIARIAIRAARGSTPREAGSFMLVTPDAQAGTIGGGHLEWDSVIRARALLAGQGQAGEHDVPLGPEIGQCCGGVVRVRIERADDALLDALVRDGLAARAARPVLLLFGAGHVGRALARALAPLPLRLVWIDPRAAEFGTVPDSVEIRVTADWESAIAAAPPGAGALVLTPSHALDALIVGAALERGDFRYVGLIGSKTKRRRFEAGFRSLGLGEDRIETLVCPIGDRGIRDKRPEIIAALVAAEIVERLLHDNAGMEESNGAEGIGMRYTA